MILKPCFQRAVAERVGFEPTVPFGHTRFRVVRLQPDSAISPYSGYILPKVPLFVKTKRASAALIITGQAYINHAAFGKTAAAKRCILLPELRR